MRKQTKVVAVASAAALLAIGGAMTSFAAQGWVEEDGTWYYYDKDGNRVEDEWKKSGDNWFWLDSEEGGAMATDKLVDDDDDTYYVDGNGVMVTNTWVKVVNEDQDDDDPAEYRYYYMQNSGKAYKAKDSGNTTFKTIDGKKYAFDEDGKMLYGWVNDDSTLATDDSDWETAEYYMGSWEDGALKTGWQKVSVYDQDEDDDYDYWFNCKSNGEKRTATVDKKINGKHYRFDERGVMVYEWALASGATASSSSVSNWQYFNSPEDGARVTKGWFKVVPPNEDNTFDSNFSNGGAFDTKDADDEDENWYYSNGDGTLETGKIKKIKGKYYGFMPDDGREGAGKMMTGLNLIKVDSATGIVDDVILDDMDSDDIDDLLDGDYDSYLATGYTLYYFGSDEDTDGAMKTGAVSATIDGDSYNFFFRKSGGTEKRGAGVNGIDDNKYIYKAGLRIKAGSDDKYKVVEVVNTNPNGTTLDINTNDYISVKKLSGSAVRRQNTAGTPFVNNDDDTVNYYKLNGQNYRLVNSTGSVVKNKSGIKDGDDWYFFVNNYDVKLYASEKNVEKTKNAAGKTVNSVLVNWKNDFAN